MGIEVRMRVRKDGRVIIPQTTRDFYEIHEGDILEIEILKIKHQNGVVIDLSDREVSADAPS